MPAPWCEYPAVLRGEHGMGRCWLCSRAALPFSCQLLALVEASAGRLGFSRVSCLPWLLMPGPDVSLGSSGGSTLLCSPCPSRAPSHAANPRSFSPWQGGW